jgi:flagellar motility protein MotE (MotC chaperone)
VSFGGAFGLGWVKPDLLKKSQQQPEQAVEQQTQADTEAVADAAPVPAQTEEETQRAMTRTQLKGLVSEVRDKVTEYENKLKSLESQEQRLAIAQAEVQKDIDKLNNLRVELAAAVASLKSERDKLEKSLVSIGEVEKQNLTAIAATYDKMQADSAGKILVNMTKAGTGGSGLDDAVKILYYMTERTKGKLLSDMALSEPDLAALLCQKLKKVVEVR